MVREMKYTEIGDIPADWEVQTFEETFRVLSNNTLSRAELNDRGGSVRNIHYGDILIKYSEVLDCGNEDVPYLNDASALTASAMPLQDGDVIIADTAEDAMVGKATEIAGLGDKKMVSGLHTIPCRVKKGDFASGWLGYYMNSHVYHDQVLPYVTGIKVSSISKSVIAETLVLVPSKEEQGSIVAALSEIDIMIRNLEKIIDKKQAVRQGAMQELLLGKRRLDNFSSPWKETTLGSIADIKDGTHQTPHYVESGIPFYSVETITTGDFYNVKKISEEEHKLLTATCRIEKGDVLMTRIGSLGKCHYVSWEANASFYVSLALLKFRGNHKLARFVTYLSELESFAREVELNSLQFAIPMKINLGKIADIRLRIPSNQDECEALVDIFSDMEKEIKELSDEKKKCELIKQGMMSELLTGKIRLV